MINGSDSIFVCFSSLLDSCFAALDVFCKGLDAAGFNGGASAERVVT